MKKTSIIILLCAFVFSMQNISARQSKKTLSINSVELIEIQDKYQPFKIDKFSEIIKAAVEKDFLGASITEAFTDKKGNYKLVLVIDNDTKIVHTNARGEWFNSEK